MTEATHDWADSADRRLQEAPAAPSAPASPGNKEAALFAGQGRRGEESLPWCPGPSPRAALAACATPGRGEERVTRREVTGRTIKVDIVPPRYQESRLYRNLLDKHKLVLEMKYVSLVESHLERNLL